MRLPSTYLFSDQFLEKVRESVYLMLQSALFYMTAYGARGFYSFLADGIEPTSGAGPGRNINRTPPYGITLLTLGRLTESQFEEIERAVNDLARRQREELKRTWPDDTESFKTGLEKGSAQRSDYPESLLRNEFKFPEDRNGYGEAIWKSIIADQKISVASFYSLVRTVEKAANIEVEHQFPRAAFVLSQSSYLESVGFVEIKSDCTSREASTYLDLVAEDETVRREFREISRLYELARWEMGRGILPYDVVHNIGVKSGRPLRSPQSLKSYLLDKWEYPDPGAGFHLIDLDAHFVFPEIGIRCVRRGLVGSVGRFREGSPPTDSVGLKPYQALCSRVPRLVAGVTGGNGEAYLIADRRVFATYRRRTWDFYSREDAIELLLGETRILSRSAGREEEARGLANSLLRAAETLSHTFRKGAIFVLTNEDVDSWGECKGRKNHLVQMAEFRSVKDLPDVHETEEFVSLAQVDGCCVIAADGKILGYAYKIGVSPRQAFRGSAAREEAFRKRIREPGSRRWSAAMLSSAQVDWDVMTVSSDGPVTLYRDGHIIPIYPTGEAERAAKEAKPAVERSKQPGERNDGDG